MTRTTASSKFGVARLLVALMVAAFAIGGLAQQAQADAIVFSPFGNGNTGPTLQAQSFDWFPGSALARNLNNVNGVPQNTQFTLYYQSFLTGVGTTGTTSAVIDSGLTSATRGDVLVNPGLQNSQHAFTIAAAFTEQITGVNVTFNPTTGNWEREISFGVVPGTAPNFVNIYAVTPGSFDVRQGTGFAQGTPIMTATVSTQGFSASFKQIGTASAANPTGTFVPTLGAFDTFDTTDADLGLQSILGNGSTNLVANVTSANAAYFPNGLAGLQLVFQTTNSLPFNAVTPSLRFFNGSAVFDRNILPINGFNSPDTEFQADASNNFVTAVVPEPGSVSMALTGLGILSLVGLRARRRRP